MRKLLNMLARLEEFLLAVIFLTMVAIFSGAVFAREISVDLARRTEWVDEATRYLMVWLVFLSLGLALQRGRQIAMTSYLERMPPRGRWGVRKAIDLLGLLFSIFVGLFGVEITIMVFNSGQRSPTLGVTNAVLYLALPVGFGLLALRYAASLFSIIDRVNPDPAGSGGH